MADQKPAAAAGAHPWHAGTGHLQSAALCGHDVFSLCRIGNACRGDFRDRVAAAHRIAWTAYLGDPDLDPGARSAFGRYGGVKAASHAVENDSGTFPESEEVFYE